MDIMNNGDHKFTPAMLAAIELAKTGALDSGQALELDVPVGLRADKLKVANDIPAGYDLDM